MPLYDDLAEPLTEAQLKRRKLLTVLGSGALATATAGTAVTAVRFLSPGVLYETSSRLKVGALETIPVGACLAFPRQKIYVVRTGEGLHALSATCTHLGCMTQYEAQHKRLFCPCHGSQFDLAGRVVGGPAPKPLPRFKLSIDKGLVVVDTQRLAEPDEIVKV